MKSALPKGAGWAPEPRLDDARWDRLKGGYRTPYDPRPALRRFAQGDDSKVWDELWEELHHQGDVGQASYAAVPHLVALYEARGLADWNVYSLVGTIELCRMMPGNPRVNRWLEKGYHEALSRLAALGRRQLESAADDTLVRCILGVVAIVSGQRALGRAALEFEGDELSELLWPDEDA
ncbi:MAG TPA: hypothetical protein VF815_16715 [Myxococcaceae bacterium]|jgi:hypothetical protein